jgi:hypothetical protein
MKKNLNIIFEWVRWISIIIAIQIGYFSYFSNTLQVRFPIVVLILILSISGLSGIESMFLSKEATKITGYKPSGYQRQNALFFFALAITGIIIFVLKWNLQAHMTALFVLLIFLLFSSINHLYSALNEKAPSFRNIYLRFFASILLIAVIIPIIIKVFSIM